MPNQLRFAADMTRLHAVVATTARGPVGRFAARTPGCDRNADPKPEGVVTPSIDWNDLLPRQVVAVGGGFVAAVGIAFMIVGGSPEGLPFTLAGLAAAAGGFAVELAPRLRQAIGNFLDDPREETLGRHVPGGPARPNRPGDLPCAADAGGDPAPPLQGVIVREPPRRLWHPRAAAVMSVVPGLGHVYKGSPAAGLCWLAAVTAGYSAFVLPGVFLHGLCLLDSLTGSPWTMGRTSVVRP